MFIDVLIKQDTMSKWKELLRARISKIRIHPFGGFVLSIHSTLQVQGGGGVDRQQPGERPGGPQGRAQGQEGRDGARVQGQDCGFNQDVK